MRFLVTAIAWLHYVQTRAATTENGLSGSPDIECAADSISVNFNTLSFFEGHVFVKGYYATQGCRTDATNSPQARISIPFNLCGVRRERSVNPLGVYMSVTVIISFHPHFITKSDRAFNLKCFYSNADKTVNSQLDVSQLSSETLTLSAPMPTCHYEVLTGGAEGVRATFAQVGDKVYHRWSCTLPNATHESGGFCMTVHSCFVDDGRTQKSQLLDENGCALDHYILNNINYTGDLTGGREAFVFRLPDSSSMFFNCQIRIELKENGTCIRTSDHCPEPRRGKREIRSSGVNEDVDVFSATIHVFDEEIDVDQLRLAKDPSNSQVLQSAPPRSGLFATDERISSVVDVGSRSAVAEGVCFSRTLFTVIVCALSVVMLVVLLVLIMFCVKCESKRKQ